VISGIKGLKYDSGVAKRKRKKVEEGIVKSEKGTLYKQSLHTIRYSTIFIVVNVSIE